MFLNCLSEPNNKNKCIARLPCLVGQQEATRLHKNCSLFISNAYITLEWQVGDEISIVVDHSGGKFGI